MALVTLEGIYENGRVKLVVKPQGVKRAKVTVTFFSNTEAEEVQTDRPNSAQTAQNESATVSGREARYPRPLREEYKVLIQKKLHRILTAEEAVRLEAVRKEINQRDRQSASWAAWESRAQEVEQKLASLRQELEALPDA